MRGSTERRARAPARRTSTTSATPRRCSTSAAAAASCSPLLREAGIEARGIDADADMVAYARGEGLDVEQADAIAYLESLEDGSLGGIFAAQVVEHLPPATLVRLLELAAAEAAPGRAARRGDDQPAVAARAAELLRRPHARAAARPRDAGAARRAGRLPRGRDALPERARRAARDPRRPGDRRQRAPAERAPVRAARLRDPRPHMRIAVCRPQVPFERGGAEIFADELVGELRARGHEADIVSMPFKWYPGERVLTQALLWRLADLTEADGRPIDLVVATKFPSYCVRHPNKVVWLLHQFRQAYELDRTELGQFSESARDRALRRSVQRLDQDVPRRGAEGVRDVAERRRRGSSARPGSRPRCCRTRRSRSPTAATAYGDFVLSVGRLDRAKRVDLMLDALAAGRVAARRGRRRRARPRAARGARSAQRARRPRDVRRPRRARRSSPISTRAASPSTTRRSTRTSAWCRTRRSCPRSPSSRRPTPAGRSRSSTTGRPGSSASRGRRARRGVRWLRDHEADARAWGRAGKAVAERVTWDRAIDRLLA